MPVPVPLPARLHADLGRRRHGLRIARRRARRLAAFAALVLPPADAAAIAAGVAILAQRATRASRALKRAQADAVRRLMRLATDQRDPSLLDAWLEAGRRDPSLE